MATTIRKIFGSVLTAVLIPMVGPAYAGLIHDLEVTPFGSDGFSGTGHIEFTTLSGSNPTGVSAFEFSGTGPLGDVSFTVNDIENVTWSINPDDWALALNLGTVLDQPLPPSSPIASCILLRNVDATGTCGGGLIPNLGGDFSAVRQLIIGRTSLRTGTLTTTAVHAAVPEPSTLALMAIGLAGLGYRRHRSRKPHNKN